MGRSYEGYFLGFLGNLAEARCSHRLLYHNKVEIFSRNSIPIYTKWTTKQIAVVCVSSKLQAELFCVKKVRLNSPDRCLALVDRKQSSTYIPYLAGFVAP